jgi:hypothetical protein
MSFGTSGQYNCLECAVVERPSPADLSELHPAADSLPAVPQFLSHLVEATWPGDQGPRKFNAKRGTISSDTDTTRVAHLFTIQRRS